MKRKQHLAKQVKECGNVTDLCYGTMNPNNAIYKAITEALTNDYPVLPTTRAGEIPANKAFVLDVGDIYLNGGESVKDCIAAVADARSDYFGDLRSAFVRDKGDKVKEYYLDSTLCYGWDMLKSKHMVLTNSKTVLEEIPITGRNNTLKNINETWLDFDKYENYRLFPRAQGFYIEKRQIDLSRYYICPLSYIESYKTKFAKLVSKDVLMINYILKENNITVKCTLNKDLLSDKISNYLNSTEEKIGVIRVYDMINNRIVAIPICGIISYVVWQHC